MRKILFIAGGILVLVAIFFLWNHDWSSFGASESYRDNSNPAEGNSEQEMRQERYGGQGFGVTEDKSDCDVEFTEYLIDPKYVQKVGQVGVVHGFGKTIVERSYISVKQDFKEQQIPIYAPTDMSLIGGAHYKVSNDPNYMPDYVLKFNTECNVEILLGHLKGVVGSIDEQMTPLKNDSREDYFRPVEFKAGDLIGYYYQQASGGVAGFDFVVRDRRVVNKFINQERYSDMRADNLISGVCPYDFYTGEKKEAYYNLLGGGGGTVFAVKDCGNASRDIAGTISGMWFLDKEVVGSIYDYYMDGNYGSPVSVVGDEERVAIGNLGNQEPVIYIWSNNPSHKLPQDVTGEHCYQRMQNQNTPEGYVYFKVVDDATIDVSYSASGTCPSVFPSGNAKRYYK